MATPESILDRLELFGMKLGLESTRRLLEALGAPHRALPVVLVAGTNGKGSTAALVASILGAAGRRVGLYTSPHLEDVEERIRVAGRCIDRAALGGELERVVSAGERVLDHPPTYFEALTVAAFCHFAAAGVEIAVMEVGMGGRLDATNVADPVLSVITSISRDHVQVLGDSLAKIAREKAGILRPGGEAVCWVEAPEARRTLVEEAQRLRARLVDARPLVRWHEEPAPGSARLLELCTPGERYRLELALEGAYQPRNVGLAVVAAEMLAAQGWPLTGDAVRDGVARCTWPGRCETVELPGGSLLLLDAAHNEEGIGWLRRELEARSPNGTTGPGGGWRLVFGALNDKPAPAMLETIAAGAERVILAPPASPRALDPGALLAFVPAGRGEVARSAAAALDLALADGPARVVACGSIYLVGELRREVRSRFGVPLRASATWDGLG